MKKLDGLIVAAILSSSLLSLMAFGANQAEQLTGRTVQLDASVCWVVWPEEPEALQRALRDVEQDWYKVFGRLPTVLKEPPKQKNWSGPIIYLGVNAPWLKSVNKDKLSAPESFTLQVQSDEEQGMGRIVAVGADVRGGIYAAYALSEEFLGVDPWYYWVDKHPTYKGNVQIPANYHKVWGPPTFKYRGFFVNDEDLLARFSPDPMDDNIFSLVMWDRIFETLLRLRGNTIVPGTFTFPDERCQVLADKRGLINSQHHILTVGLNTYQWPDEVPFSYHRNPEILEKYWQRCIEVMKDREVVWTVGYRGKHDRPFWSDDKTIKTIGERGRLISKAIARQVKLVRRFQPEADCICNLWMEGAEMYQQGHIKLPKGVIAVWPDNGTGTIRDGGQVKAGDGIYYHTAMFNGSANQLTELVNPARIHSELSRFVRAGATSYFVVNISDVRPVPMTTDYAMKMAWDASTELEKTSEQAMDDHLLSWSRNQFGRKVAKPLAQIYREYLTTPYLQEKRCGDNRVFWNISSTVNRLSKEVRAGGLSKKSLSSAQNDAKTYGRLHQRFCNLAERAERLKSKVPQDRRDFYQAHVLTQIAIYRHGFAITEFIAKAALALGDKDTAKAIEHLDEALSEYDAFFRALRKAEYSPWQGWYAGDRFVYIYQTHHHIRQCRAILADQAPPAPTLPRERYPILYRYQKKFKKNFPLMYPQK